MLLSFVVPMLLATASVERSPERALVHVDASLIRDNDAARLSVTLRAALEQLDRTANEARTGACALEQVACWAAAGAREGAGSVLVARPARVGPDLEMELTRIPTDGTPPSSIVLRAQASAPETSVRKAVERLFADDAARYPSRIALAPIRANGVGAAEVAVVEDAIQDQIAAHAGAEVASAGESSVHKDALTALGFHCDDIALDCLVKLGELAGAAWTVGAILSSSGRDDVIELSLVDVAERVELARERRALVEGARAPQLAEAVRSLLDPENHRGSLRVVSPTDGARVWLDDLLEGTTPLAAPLRTRAGTRRVRLDAPGHAPVEKGVVVRSRDEVEVRVALQRVTPAAAASPPEAAAVDAVATTTPERVRVLVLDPIATGEGGPSPQTIAGVIAAELQRQPAFDVVTTADLRRLMELEVERQSVGCSDESCLVELAGALGAQLVVFGDVGSLGNLIVVNVSLFDAERARSVARESIQVRSVEELPPKVAAALREMTAPLVAQPALEEEEALEPLAFVPWIVAAGGGAVLVAGAAMLWPASEAGAAYNDGYDAYQASALSYDEAVERRDELKRHADAYHGWGVGALVTIAVGTALLVGAASFALWNLDEAAP